MMDHITKPNNIKVVKN